MFILQPHYVRFALLQTGQAPTIIAMAENPNMPPALRGLSDQERAFVLDFVKGGCAERAKTVAGYGEKTHPHYLLRRPSIVAAIRWEVARGLATEGAQIGFAALKRLAADKEAPAAAQVAAAKALLQGAGLLDAPVGDKETKSINDMSREELRAFIERSKDEIAKMEAAIADRATPIPQTIEAQATDNASVFD